MKDTETKKMTYDELFGLLQNLQTVAEIRGNEKFTYGVSKNTDKLRRMLKPISKQVIKPPKEYFEYMKKAQVLRGSVNPKSQDATARLEVSKKLGELDKEYKKALDETKANEEKNKKIYEQEVEVDFHLIDRANVPDMTIKERDILNPFIAD